MQNQTQDGATRGYIPRHAQPVQQPQQQPQWTNYQPTPQQYQQPLQYQPQYQQPAYQPQYQQPIYQQPQPDRLGFFKKRDTVLLVSAIFAVVWYIIVCSSFASLMNATPTGTEAEQLGQEIGNSIGLMLQIPFLITAFIGIVFNWLSWFMSKRGFAITAGVLFSVSVFLSIGNAIGYIVCLVLCFVGASRLKKQMA